MAWWWFDGSVMKHDQVGRRLNLHKNALKSVEENWMDEKSKKKTGAG